MSPAVNLGTAVLVLATLACSVSIPSIRGLTGSGNVVTLEQDFADFDRVEISHAFHATITQGDSFAVVVRVDDNLEPLLQVEQVGDTLSIGLTDETGFGTLSATLEVDITLPSLAAVDASGASQVVLVDIASPGEIHLDGSGASRFNGDLEAHGVALTLSGAGSPSLRGGAQELRVVGSGASTADLEEFPVTNAEVILSGAGTTTVVVSGTLSVDASGASRVTYLGSPSLGDVNVSGGSSVEPG